MSTFLCSTYISPIISFISIIIAIIALVIAYLQYLKLKQFNKAKYFFDIRAKYKGDNRYCEIRYKIENNESLKTVNIISIFDNAGFFEELQIAINSKIIDKKMVFYLFGYYIIRFYEAVKKDGVINIESSHWLALNEIYKSMIEIQKLKLNYSKDLKF